MSNDKPPGDLYTAWLGIAAGPRPPDHYALLGLERFEKDPEKVRAAARERMKQVRARCLKFPKEGTQLLNEIAAAQVCLLDEKAREGYDQSLSGPVLQVENAETGERLTYGVYGVEGMEPTAEPADEPEVVRPSRGRKRPTIHEEEPDEVEEADEPTITAQRTSSHLTPPVAIGLGVGGALIALGMLLVLIVALKRKSAEPTVPGMVDDSPIKSSPGEPYPWRPERLLAALGECRGTSSVKLRELTYARDSRYLVGSGAGPAVCLWDARTLDLLATVRGPGREVLSVAATPSGKFLALSRGDEGAPLRVWDLSDPNSSQPYPIRPGTEPVAALSPDGKLLALRETERTVVLWDLATQGRLQPALEHVTDVQALAFAPDGALLACGELGDLSHGAVQLWNVASRQKLRREAVGKSRVRHLAFAAGGRQLALLAGDEVCLWPLDLVPAALADAPRAVRLAFTPDGRSLAWMTTRAVTVRDLGPGSGSQHPSPTGEELRAQVFAPDGSAFIFASDYSLWQRDRRASGGARGSSRSRMGAVTALAFAPTGERLAVGYEDRAVRLWEIGRREEAAVLATIPVEERTATPGTAGALAFTPDGTSVTIATRNGAVASWNLTTRQATNLQPAPAGAGDGWAALATGNGDALVMTEEGEGAARAWKLSLWATGDRRKRDGPGTLAARPSCGGIAPDGTALALGVSPGGRGDVVIWDVRKGKASATLKGHRAAITALTYAPLGHELAVGDASGGLKLWDGVTGKEVATLALHNRPLSAIAFSRDGRRLLSADVGGQITLCDPTTRLPLISWNAPTGITRVALSDDGKRAAVGDTNGSVYVLLDPSQ